MIATTPTEAGQLAKLIDLRKRAEQALDMMWLIQWNMSRLQRLAEQLAKV